MKPKKEKKEKRSKIAASKVASLRFILVGLTFIVLFALLISLIYLFVFVCLFEPTLVWIPFLVYFVFTFVVPIFILNSQSQINFKASWLVVLLIFPFIGIFCYIFFARKVTTKRNRNKRYNKLNTSLITNKDDSTLKLKEARKFNEDYAIISQYIDKNAYASLYTNSEVKYFNFGQKGFPYMLDALEKAKKFIFMEYFIIKDGEMFGKIYKILKEKASQGVDVRLIYDDFGSVKGVSSKFVRSCKKDHIKAVCFNRLRPVLDIRQNSRDHRKITIIDGVVAFTGGCNLADEYINKEVRFGNWRDNLIMVKGEATNGFLNLFLSVWNTVYKPKKKEEKVVTNYKDYTFENNKDFIQEKFKGEGFVQVFGEIPFDGEQCSRNSIIQLISRAKKSVTISTPYLIIDDEMKTALTNAARSGIDVRIITPGIPDKKIVFSLTRSYYSQLMVAGVKIYEYTPGFNHAKIYLIDDQIALTGTINLDYRSLYLHYENGILIYGNKAVGQIKEDLESMINVSALQPVTKYLNAPLIKKLWWSFLKIFAPLI